MAAKGPKIAPLTGRGSGTIRWNPTRGCVELRHVVNGTRYTERDKTRQGAITKRDQTRARLARPDQGTTTVAVTFAKWFTHHHKSGTQGTSDGYTYTIAKINDRLGDRLIDSVTVTDLESMFGSLIADGYSSGTIRRIRSTLNQGFAYAARHGLITANVARLIVMPAGAKPAKGSTWLDEDEAPTMQRFLVADGSTIATLSLVQLTTGARPGEAAAVVWSDVDLDNGRMSIRANVGVSDNGRTRVRTDRVKTVESRRVVVLPAVTVAALRRHKINQTTTRLASTDWDTRHDLVFTTDTGQLLSGSLINRTVGRWCKDLGLTVISSNGFRHTFASLLLAANVPIPTVAKAMGHKDSRMIVSTYGHTMKRNPVDTSDLFDRWAV